MMLTNPGDILLYKDKMCHFLLMLSEQEDGHKVIDLQTPNVSPSTQSVGSANSSGGATDLFSNSPIVPVNNQ